MRFARLRDRAVSVQHRVPIREPSVVANQDANAHPITRQAILPPRARTRARRYPRRSTALTTLVDCALKLYTPFSAQTPLDEPLGRRAHVSDPLVRDERLEDAHNLRAFVWGVTHLRLSEEWV